MAKTYSYDPSKINENGMDKMRLELGDTIFNPGELTAALCDEEYIALIESSRTWNQAKAKCLKAIVMRFAHQVNVSIDGISYSFQERLDVWKQMYKEAKIEASTGVPTANPKALIGREGGPPYFYNNMHANWRRF